jgi:hypothetical protein
MGTRVDGSRESPYLDHGPFSVNRGETTIIARPGAEPGQWGNGVKDLCLRNRREAKKWLDTLRGGYNWRY